MVSSILQNLRLCRSAWSITFLGHLDFQITCELLGLLLLGCEVEGRALVGVLLLGVLVLGFDDDGIDVGVLVLGLLEDGCVDGVDDGCPVG